MISGVPCCRAPLSRSLSRSIFRAFHLQSSPASSNAGKTNLIGLSRSEINALFEGIGQASFRGAQVWRWLYNRGSTDIDSWTDLNKDLRAKLKETHYASFSPSSKHSISADGTQKWLVGEAETVFIPNQCFSGLTASTGPEGAIDDLDLGRGTVCISSQVGCSMTCTFCHTGSMPKSRLRNLSAGEIVGQVMLAKHSLGDFDLVNPNSRNNADSDAEGRRSVGNLVLMGMGEPLYNYRNVKKALEIIMDGAGLGYGNRRITLSTCGVVPGIDRLGTEIGVNLAISLHAVRDELRDVLVPINKTFPIAELLAACRRYPGVRNARKITFEYVLLKGVNDSPADAAELVRLVKGIPALINLIPFNPWPGSSYEASTVPTTLQFAKVIHAAENPSLKCTVRWPRGQDILAACGQLASSVPPPPSPRIDSALPADGLSATSSCSSSSSASSSSCSYSSSTRRTFPASMQ